MSWRGVANNLVNEKKYIGCISGGAHHVTAAGGAIKHQIDVELGAIFDTAADRQGKLKELINEIVEYADGKVKNLVLKVQETITD